MQILQYLIKSEMLNTVTVLDVGARSADLGHWTALGRKLRYLGFEPDMEECERLNTIAIGRKTFEERYFPIVLGKDNEDRIFYIAEDPACSSLLEPNSGSFKEFSFNEKIVVKTEIKVRTYTLMEWASRYSVSEVDFIKLDVQGAELEILKSGGDVVGSVLGLEIEVEFIEIYKNQPLFGDIDAWVRSKGFILFDISKAFCKRLVVAEDVPSHGQLTWGDAIYLRDVNSLFKEPEGVQACADKLVKLAAIADLYGRPDYSLFVLEKAIEKYSKFLGDKLYDINCIISEVRSHLAKADKNKEQTTEGVFERFRNCIAVLYGKKSQNLSAETEERSRGYIWRK